MAMTMKRAIRQSVGRSVYSCAIWAFKCQHLNRWNVSFPLNFRLFLTFGFCYGNDASLSFSLVYRCLFTCCFDAYACLYGLSNWDSQQFTLNDCLRKSMCDQHEISHKNSANRPIELFKLELAFTLNLLM